MAFELGLPLYRIDLAGVVSKWVGDTPKNIDQIFRMAEGSLSMSGFKTQFREHAEQARRHGDGHRAAVALNQVLSAGIVGAYEALRRVRSLRRRAAA